MALVAIYPLKSATQLLEAFFFLVVKLNMLINIKSSDVVFFAYSYANTYVSIWDEAEAWMDTCVHITISIM